MNEADKPARNDVNPATWQTARTAWLDWSGGEEVELLDRTIGAVKREKSP